MNKQTFNEWWYDYRIKNGIRGVTNAKLDIAQSAWEAAQRSSGPAEPPALKLEWRDGYPPNPWDKEWFIAETEFGKMVLRALPEDYSYDFKTADETYIKKEKIKRWMQFPDSDFIAPESEAGKDSSLFKDRTAQSAAWQLAMMFAQATECLLTIYRACSGKSIPLYIKNPLSEYCASMVYHCRDLNVKPQGLGGKPLPNLAFALEHPGFYGEEVVPKPYATERSEP